MRNIDFSKVDIGILELLTPIFDAIESRDIAVSLSEFADLIRHQGVLGQLTEVYKRVENSTADIPAYKRLSRKSAQKPARKRRDNTPQA